MEATSGPIPETVCKVLGDWWRMVSGVLKRERRRRRRMGPTLGRALRVRSAAIMMRERREGLPSEKLFGKGALVAIGVVLQAEVLVNLEESLLMPCFFQEEVLFFAVAKESVGGSFDAFGWGASREVGVGGPILFGVFG